MSVSVVTGECFGDARSPSTRYVSSLGDPGDEAGDRVALLDGRAPYGFLVDYRLGTGITVM